MSESTNPKSNLNPSSISVHTWFCDRTPLFPAPTHSTSILTTAFARFPLQCDTVLPGSVLRMRPFLPSAACPWPTVPVVVAGSSIRHWTVTGASDGTAMRRV